MTKTEAFGLLKRKVIGFPTGLEPPSLATLLDRAADVLKHPNWHTEKSVDFIQEDMLEALQCIINLMKVVPLLREQYRNEENK